MIFSAICSFSDQGRGPEFKSLAACVVWAGSRAACCLGVSILIGAVAQWSCAGSANIVAYLL